MRNESGKDKNSCILEDDDHWKMQQGFEKYGSVSEKGTLECLNLLRNKTGRHLLHELAGLKPRGGQEVEETTVDESTA